MTKITIEGDFTFEDVELRKWTQQLQTKVDSINDRTKRHTIQIIELQKGVKTNDIKR